MKIKDQIGKIYEGRFKVVDYKIIRRRYYFFLQNIFNNQVLKVEYRTMKKLDEGSTTISGIIHYKIKRRKI